MGVNRESSVYHCGVCSMLTAGAVIEHTVLGTAGWKKTPELCRIANENRKSEAENNFEDVGTVSNTGFWARMAMMTTPPMMTALEKSGKNQGPR